MIIVESMSTRNSEGRYAEICGATNNRGDPCKLPAGWGTPGSGGKRCKFHGGCSTGPDDTDHLEGNDYAKDNPGGGAPKLNTNASRSGAWCDWRKAYERLDGTEREFVNELMDDARKRAIKNAPEMPAEKREALLKEYATLDVIWNRATTDQAERGLMLTEEIEVNGETYTHHKINPTLDRNLRLSYRERKIADELNLW